MAEVGAIGAALSQNVGASWRDRNNGGDFKKDSGNTAIPGKKNTQFTLFNLSRI